MQLLSSAGFFQKKSSECQMVSIQIINSDLGPSYLQRISAEGKVAADKELTNFI